MVLGTPTMYVDMLSQLDPTVHDLTSLHSGIMAGSPCPLTLREKVIKQMELKTLHVGTFHFTMAILYVFCTL